MDPRSDTHQRLLRPKPNLSANLSERGGKVSLSFDEIRGRLRSAHLESLRDVEVVVGIGTGGTTPALMVAFELGLPVEIIRLNLRDDENEPHHEQPVLIGNTPDVRGKRVLLVDDVSVSGATLSRAKELLPADDFKTMVMKGKKGSADIVLFTEIPSCVIWPW